MYYFKKPVKYLRNTYVIEKDSWLVCVQQTSISRDNLLHKVIKNTTWKHLFQEVQDHSANSHGCLFYYKLQVKVGTSEI